MNEFGRRGRLVHVALGAGSDGFEDAFIIHAGTGDNDAQVRTDGFEAGHDVIEILAVAVAEQDEIDAGKLADVRERGGDQFQISFGIEEGPESYKPQWIALYHGDTNDRFFGDSNSSFHQGFPVRIASCLRLPESDGN